MRIILSNCKPIFASTRIDPSLSGDVIATIRFNPSAFRPYSITATADS
jgi:hypothetical protein